jgi:hypothetical protein
MIEFEEGEGEVAFVVVGDTTTAHYENDPLMSKQVATWIKHRNDRAVEQEWDEADPVNFYITQDGKVLEGLGWDKRGRWTKGFRIDRGSGVTLERALYVLFLGCGHLDFTEAAAKAFRDLLDEIQKRYPEFQRVVFEKDVVFESRSGGVDVMVKDDMPSLYRWAGNGMVPFWVKVPDEEPVSPDKEYTDPNAHAAIEDLTPEQFQAWYKKVALEMQTVRLGDVSDSVQVLQLLLREFANADGVVANGAFGESTQDAVARLQATNKLEGERGVADEAVWRHLLKVPAE